MWWAVKGGTLMRTRRLCRCGEGAHALKCAIALRNEPIYLLSFTECCRRDAFDPSCQSRAGGAAAAAPVREVSAPLFPGRHNGVCVGQGGATHPEAECVAS